MPTRAKKRKFSRFCMISTDRETFKHAFPCSIFAMHAMNPMNSDLHPVCRLPRISGRRQQVSSQRPTTRRCSRLGSIRLLYDHNEQLFVRFASSWTTPMSYNLFYDRYATPATARSVHTLTPFDSHYSTPPRNISAADIFTLTTVHPRGRRIHWKHC